MAELENFCGTLEKTTLARTPGENNTLRKALNETIFSQKTRWGS